MVAVITTQVIDVQGNLGVIDKTLEKLEKQVDVKTAYSCPGKRNIVFQPRSPGEIDDHPRQGLIQRHVGVAVSENSFFITCGPGKGLAQSDADILHSVVVIDVQVTRLRRKLEDDPRQPTHLQTVRGEGYVLWATAVES